ncbi:hypothetical protein ACJW31_05G100200 [Castanea mollissima]
MEVKISHTTLVSPTTKPFPEDHTLPLSHLDTDPNLHVTFRYLRTYLNTAAAAAKDPFQVISAALSAALVHYYPLAATLRQNNHLFCSAENLTVPLIHATVDDTTLDSLNYLDDNPDAHFLEQLVPDPDQEERLVNPCVLQVTVFKCGGFTLGAAIHHSLCDGLGATQFFNVMAELARGATRVSVEPVWDRTSLLGPRDPPRVEAPIREFLSLEKGFSSYSEEIGPVLRECFNVSDECLEKFKTALFERCGLKFTTFEALGAFIWRAKVKASKIPGEEKVKFAYAINMRKQVKPPLPAVYWGNGCVPMYAQLSAKELVEKPIWETAQVINKSKSRATDEYVRSFIDFQHLHYGDGITAGKGVSGFTDWRHLGHSTVDFGWGGPVTVLPLSRNLLGSVEPCFFLPYSSVSAGRKDGFKVLVNLRESAMPAFKEEMKGFGNHEFGLSRY